MLAEEGSVGILAFHFLNTIAMNNLSNILVSELLTATWLNVLQEFPRSPRQTKFSMVTNLFNLKTN